MNNFISSLEKEFLSISNPENARKQKAYMRNQFEFYGIKAGDRKEIQKPFLNKQYLPLKEDMLIIVKELWSKPEREYQHFAQEFVFKYSKKFELKDIELLEYMVMQKSWWDTVDYIAYKLMGQYFKLYPEQIETYINKWLNSKNIWLQRSALLFQLKYKEDLNTELLSLIINRLLGSKEFFINKAIGWVLREYSRTAPSWVIEFVNKTALHPLSKREALRLL